MKKYLLLCLTSIALFSVYSSEKANAATITVPFTWEFTQTTGPGQNNAAISINNNGPFGNIENDSDNLAGTFTIRAIHTPPPNYKSRLDQLPTMINFGVNGTLSGSFSNSTIDANIGGFGFDSFVRVDANISLADGGNLIFNREGGELGPSFGEIGPQTQTSQPISVMDGTTLAYTGNINGSTKFGFGGENLDFINVFSQILVEGDFIGDTSFDIRYHVPEPLTILGSFTVIGMGAILKKKHLNNFQKLAQ